MNETPGKWIIAKRHEDKSPYTIERWPWLLTYPDGEHCLCITYAGAVHIIKDSQRTLRSSRDHLGWLKRRYLAGSVRAREVVTR